MADAKSDKRSLKQRLGLSSKSSAPRQRLIKKEPDGLQRDPDYGYDTRPTQLSPNYARPDDDHIRSGRSKSIATTSFGYSHDEDRRLQPPPYTPVADDTHRRYSEPGGSDFHRDVIDKDTGERKDMTEMLHALHYDAVLDEIPEQPADDSPAIDPTRPRGEQILALPSAEIWDCICDYLNPRDAANLALTCKTVGYLLGRGPFDRLQLAANKEERVDFLLPMDSKYPFQLFCFPCACYHARLDPGFETLKPTAILNPLFQCPNSTNALLPPPRHRITSGRTLPYTFVQLAARHHRYGAPFGIPFSALDRRWGDPASAWTHHSRYLINPKTLHLIFRVRSSIFVTPGLTMAAKRLLLFSRTDYVPYFSVCAHWRDGLLMDLCKCALTHIPVPRTHATAIGAQRAARQGPVTLCGECMPMRRCPLCPTEYLIEVRLLEDRAVAVNDVKRFKQALIVTRWSDLGDGVRPDRGEWAAVQGLDGDGYDSFGHVGTRSISATFESAFGDFFPGQRLVSLNPKGVRRAPDEESWY